MRKHCAIASVIALTLVLASASSVLALSGGSERPWSGHAEGQTWFDFTNPNGCMAGWTTRAEVPAIASHFGESQIVMSHCSTGNPASSFARSSITLIAANGDSVFGTYVGTTDQYDGVVGHEGVFTIHVTITGGTGRFEGATGSAVMDTHLIVEADLSWPWWVSWDGTLSY